MNIFEFMSDSPWLTFFLGYFVAWCIVNAFAIPFKHMSIRKHGWPPEHCDADGDFRDEE